MPTGGPSAKLSEPERFDQLAGTLYLSSPDRKSWAVFDGSIVAPKPARYRYLLGRVLAETGPRIGWVLLNPSTASHEKNDPTIRKCIGFAKGLGAREILVANCYAFRATQPRDLKHAFDPIGPFNENALVSLATHCDYVIAAWGRHARARGVETGKLLAKHSRSDLRCLGLNKDGSPKHPLYVPYPTNDDAWFQGPPKFNPYEVVEGSKL